MKAPSNIVFVLGTMTIRFSLLWGGMLLWIEEATLAVCGETLRPAAGLARPRCMRLAPLAAYQWGLLKKGQVF